MWLGFVTLLAGLGVGLVASGAFSRADPGPGARPDPHPPSGERWCVELATVRPFAGIVNEGLIGGLAFPYAKVGRLAAVEAAGGTPPPVDSDFEILFGALSGANNVVVQQTRIAAFKVDAAKAAAARLDLYCAINHR